MQSYLRVTRCGNIPVLSCLQMGDLPLKMESIIWLHQFPLYLFALLNTMDLAFHKRHEKNVLLVKLSKVTKMC